MTSFFNVMISPVLFGTDKVGAEAGAPAEAALGKSFFGAFVVATSCATAFC